MLAVLALVIVSIVVSPAGRGPLPVPTTTPDGPATDPRQGLVQAEQAATTINTLQGRFTRIEHAMPTVRLQRDRHQ